MVEVPSTLLACLPFPPHPLFVAMLAALLLVQVKEAQLFLLALFTQLLLFVQEQPFKQLLPTLSYSTMVIIVAFHMVI